jgi:hypothetical protein
LGIGAAMAVEGATTKAVFETYVEEVLAPMLEPGQNVVMDNLGAPKGERVKKVNETQSKLVSGVFRTVNLYAPPPDVVVASSPRVGRN